MNDFASHGHPEQPEWETQDSDTPVWEEAIATSEITAPGDGNDYPTEQPEDAVQPVSYGEAYVTAMLERPEWNLLHGSDVTATPDAAAQADLGAEVKRTAMSIVCAVDAYYGDTSKMPQLSPEQQAKLVADTQSIGNEEALEVFTYALLTHDIGKNRAVVQAMGLGPEADHDQVYTALLTDTQYEDLRQALLPGFDELPDWGKQRLLAMAESDINYPQILQGEAPAAALEQVESIGDPRVLEWDILKAKYDIFGAAGHITQEKSLAATPSTFDRMDRLDNVLKDTSLTTGKARRDTFLDSEAAAFAGPMENITDQQRSERRVIAWLSCLSRNETTEGFLQLQQDFSGLEPIVKELLTSEVNRLTRPILVYYSPRFVKTLIQGQGNEFAMEYFAHVLQEARIADRKTERTDPSEIVTAQLGDILKDMASGKFNPRESAIVFEPEGDALVARAQTPALQNLESLPQFDAYETLTDKKILLVGEGGGSDGIQAAMLGKLMKQKYGCEIVAVASIRNSERVVTGAGSTVGEATTQITDSTEPVGEWRFLEKIPLETGPDTPMYLISASDPDIIRNDVTALLDATGAELVIGVDTGGDSLYRSLHAGFSARHEQDITPDHDYVSIQALSNVAAARPGVHFMSAIIAPGVDSPPYAHEVLNEINAKRMALTQEDVTLIEDTYAAWRMDGSGSEEGRYGKTPLAWLHALRGNNGFQRLDLPKANVLSDVNPWRGFIAITPAMAGIVLSNVNDHFDAIRRDR